MAQPLSWLPNLRPLCQDIVGFEVVQEQLMSLVASVMDRCESIRGDSDVANEGRQGVRPREDRSANDGNDFDWTGLFAVDPKVSSLVVLICLVVLIIACSVSFVQSGSSFVPSHLEPVRTVGATGVANARKSAVLSHIERRRKVRARRL